ncbi:MAG: ATP-binding protein [Chitinophagaceae bacterium]
MLENVISLLTEIKELSTDKDPSRRKLNQALEIVQAIRQGNIDAVFTVNDETPKVLVPGNADQAYRKFIENMSEGVVTLLEDGVILYSNLSFANIVNLPLEKVIGSNLRNYIPAEYSETFEHFFVGGPLENLKINISISNNTHRKKYYTVSLNKLPLQDFIALDLVWTDITELTDAQEQLIITNEKLQDAIKEKIISETRTVGLNNKLALNIKALEDANTEMSTFTHIASHDLQEPLRKISTYSSLLARDYVHAIDQKGLNYIDLLINAAARMRKLINDILEYSDLSKFTVHFKATNLQLIILNVISHMQGVIDKTKASIIIDSELPILEANPDQMIQLFQNILSNSLKFIHPDINPEIHIRHVLTTDDNTACNELNKSDGKFCCIYIRDNGIGFDPIYNDRVFTIFQRLNNKLDFPGTGIGLAICKKIISQHHGSIKAEATAGRGLLITITLPVKQS